MILFKHCQHFFSFSYRCGHFLWLAIGLALSGCQTSTLSSPTISHEETIPTPPTLNLTLHPFPQTSTIISPKEIFQLREQQIQDFLQFRNKQLKTSPQDFITHLNTVKKEHSSDSQSQIQEHKIIGEYLKQLSKSFSYHGKTLTAQETLAKLNGNCMSLAVLTTALAKHMNVNISYQLVTDSPVYQKQNSVVIRGQHVRSKLYDPTYQPKPGFFALVKPSITVDYFPELFSRSDRRVSESEFLAMFYNNIAAESLIIGDYQSAYWNALEAMKYHSTNSQSLNLLALIYDKLKIETVAEQLYRFGAKHADQKVELLSNYWEFLTRHGRQKEALKIEEQLGKLNEPNPFDWLDIAAKALEANELRRAEIFFKKANKLAPYLHQPYAGLAIVAYHRGKTDKAKVLFEKALETAFNKTVKDRYNQKLQALTSQ